MPKMFHADPPDYGTIRCSIAEVAAATGQSKDAVRGTFKKAVKLGYLRWVQNHPDGTVEYRLTLPPEAQ
ncbi:hypothetical protein [Mycobacteroides chelonae]